MNEAKKLRFDRVVLASKPDLNLVDERASLEQQSAQHRRNLYRCGARKTAGMETCPMEAELVPI
jgi:hypothetical protein